MSIDKNLCFKQLENHLEVADCIRQSKSPSDVLPSYEYLYALKSNIPKELYAYYLRKLLQFNTANVPVEFRLQMLQGVDHSNLMYQEELDAISEFGSYVTIYRGTSKDEMQPGLSWSLRRDTAESSDFYRGRLFIAEIPTSSILLYLSKEEDEEEIVAYVTDNYMVIDD